MSAFREVMLTGSVSEAARNLNRTQPSISHMIARLEDEVGMKLFERRRGRLYPVPEAQYLFQECDDLISRVGKVRQNMQRIKAMESGEIRILSMPGPAVLLLPELISEHIGEHPGIRATLLARSSDAVVQLMGAQQYDIGIADHDPANPVEGSLIHAETFHFECMCAIPANDPLAAKELISPKDLSGKPMAALFPEHRTFQLTQRIFDAAGADFDVRFTGQYFLMLLTYVERGLASVVVDPISAASWRRSASNQGSIVFRPFQPALEFPVNLLTPAYRPSSLLAQSFYNRLRDLFEGLGAAT